MSRYTATKIAQIKVDIDPPPGAVQVGRLPDGKPIYKQTIDRGVNAPKLDENGKQVWAAHPTTGRPLYRERTLRSAPRERYIVPNMEGNGNLSWEEYVPPSEAEIKAAQRQSQIDQMIPSLAGQLVDQGISAADFIARLTTAPAPVPDQVPPVELETPAPAPAHPPDPNITGQTVIGEPGRWPKTLPGVGKWELSDGSKFSGRRSEAEAAQRALEVPAF